LMRNYPLTGIPFFQELYIFRWPLIFH